MSKILVAYFSASGVTAKVAEELARIENAELFEIKPETLYTKEDLDWKDKQSRSTLEMADPDCRPAVTGKVEEIEQYGLIYLGFPIWWGREPSVVDTFLDSYDFAGKKIIPFCTSGGSDVNGAVSHIRGLLGADVTVDDGKRLGGQISEADLKIWTDGLK